MHLIVQDFPRPLLKYLEGRGQLSNSKLTYSKFKVKGCNRYKYPNY
ncbi:hypothetical protein COO91_00568 [Nostoc flagelliforme CCNUN1]|uniref:Uncharacterized protein n=1 Tax=Nostoc flagelliforme CCNUN1 TaxID=2038116 RepID=A0A2K8SH31_9NOSO|nr:hypothetical protein COO91_00568 [Nostoc flagelliforme CCNUN1]